MIHLTGTFLFSNVINLEVILSSTEKQLHQTMSISFPSYCVPCFMFHVSTLLLLLNFVANNTLYGIVLWPLHIYQQKHPLNFIFLGLFTASLSLTVAVSCANTEG